MSDERFSPVSTLHAPLENVPVSMDLDFANITVINLYSEFDEVGGSADRPSRAHCLSSRERRDELYRIIVQFYCGKSGAGISGRRR